MELPDKKRLLAQLVGHERRTRSGGKDLFSHYQGGHADLANAVAGACVATATRTIERHFYLLDDNPNPGGWVGDVSIAGDRRAAGF